MSTLNVNDKCIQRNGFLALNLNEVDTKRKTCSNNLRKEFGVEISTDAYYVGIPLHVNNRPIGILRLLIKKNLVFNIPLNRKSYLHYESLHEVDITIPEIKEEKYSFSNAEDVLKYVTEIASLESISVILSKLLSSKFYSDGMRQIALNSKLSKDFDMDIVANKLAEIVNCYGCVIRLSNTSGKDASISGYSSNVKKYVDAVKATHDPYINKEKEFQSSLIRLFYPSQAVNNLAATPNNPDDELPVVRPDIECIKIDFNEDGRDEISYLKLQEESLVSCTDWTEIGLGKVHRELKKIFKSGDELFRNFDLHSIILIPIKDWNYGFVTFANTSNRPFLNRDVELLIPVVKRVGIELKYNSNLARAEAKSKKELQDGQMLISHQVMAPLVSMRNNIQNLADGTITEEDLHLRRTEIINAYTYSIDFAKSNEWLLSYMKNKEIKPQISDVRIISLLIQKARVYQTRARDTKGIRVPVIFEEGKTLHGIKSDRELLSHVLLALIDNAIKYSYNHIPPPFGIVTTDPSYPPANSNPPSQVPITLTNERGLCTITIENWGCPIEPDEVRNLTQYMQRGNNAKRFEANGSGIGLFLANQIVEALGGTLQVVPNGDHTKIILMFKQ
jgi:signal transduction histidine kinase